MKITLRLLSLLILVVVSTFYAGCKKETDDSETEEKKQLDKLVGAWTLEAANDGTDRTVDFLTEENPPAPLVLHVQGNYVEGGTYNYSFTGKRPDPSPWPESGTWKFGTNKATQIIRDPNGPEEITMNYVVTETNLEISFVVPDGSDGWPGGTSRISNVIGNWSFTFKK